MQQTTSSNDNNVESTLYQHSAKPDWGLALLLWERDGRRCYQFGDEKTRVFKEGYYHFLQPVDLPLDEYSDALRNLNRSVSIRQALKRVNSDHPVIQLSQQVDYFRTLFPKGFQSAKWAKKHRGLDANKVLKRHRNPAIKDAQAKFSIEVLRKRLDDNDVKELAADLREVLAETSLVTKAQTRGIQKLSPGDAQDLMQCLFDLLKADDVGPAFDRWARTLRKLIGKDPSWELATTLPALIRPRKHVAVKRTTFERQAVWLAPNFVMAKMPSGSAYVRFQQMMDVMSAKLAKMSLEPRDNLDLRDFIDLTLRPKAISTIQEMVEASKPISKALKNRQDSDEQAA